MAFGQEALVLFVDIAGLAAGLACPVRHEPFRDGQGNVEQEDLIRDRQAHFMELKVFQPGQIGLALVRVVNLNHLIEHITRRIAVGNDDAALFIKSLPLHLIRCEAVDGKKGRRRIGIDGVGIAAEIAAQVHLDQGAGIAVIVGIADGFHVIAVALQVFRQQPGLRRLAAAVAAFDDE